MRKLLLPLFLLLAQVSLAQIEKVIPAKPNPPRLVVDLTGTLAPDQVQALESKLVAYDDSTSNQIVVVIVPTTGDYDISDVAYQLGRNWGVGNKEFNNGVVLLIAKNDRKVLLPPATDSKAPFPISRQSRSSRTRSFPTSGGMIITGVSTTVPMHSSRPRQENIPHRGDTATADRVTTAVFWVSSSFCSSSDSSSHA
jgi:hypothetical protein